MLALEGTMITAEKQGPRKPITSPEPETSQKNLSPLTIIGRGRRTQRVG